MKYVSLLSLFFLIISHVAIGQTGPRIIIDVPTNQKPWNNIEWNDSPQRFQFAIVTDRTGGHRPGVFMDGIRKLNLLQPEFVMSVGDLIEGYTEDEAQLDAEWAEFNGFIDQLEMPFFYVPGNHDITNEVMEKKWEEIFGVTYYHFVYKDVLFLCLNSEDNRRGSNRGTIDNEQYEYIKKVLDENRDVKWTLVFLHQPLWVLEDTKRWNDVEKLLQDRDHNVFAGHHHRYYKAVRNNGKYIALATTGGGSRLRGTAFGEFDHVVWVTMTDEGPLLANLLLEGIWNEDVVTGEIADLVRNRPFPVRIEPVYIDNKLSGEVTTQVRITNDSDYPLSVKLDGVIHPSVFYKLEKTALKVDPNDVKLVNLSVINQEKVDLARISPILLKTEAQYTYEGRPDLVLRQTLNFAPNYKLKVTESAKKIKIDGKLKEWKGEWITLNEENVKGSPFHYNGSDDCTIRFMSSYDSENLYMAFEITDEELFVSEDSRAWQQDVLVVALDARPEHISATNKGAGRNAEWIAYFQNFRENGPVYNAESMPEGVVSAFSKTENGAQVEMVFPAKYLDEKQMKSWSTVRLGVGYYDFDKNGEERTEHYWYPAWNSAENIPGSGMIFKDTGLN